jgi:hypothetical protein
MSVLGITGFTGMDKRQIDVLDWPDFDGRVAAQQPNK